ncbi:hypothetical protein CsatA_005846 [Cannabis sativa]
MILRSAKKWAKTTTATAGDDLISELPDVLIQHILSNLPTEDVVRTCILSKRWENIWYSVPTLFFSKAITDDIEKFYYFVDNCLKQRKNFMIDSGIKDLISFKLYFNDYFRRRKARLVDKWLAFVVENKVKKIHLKIYKHRNTNSSVYQLPPRILDNARYLTVLKLNGVELDTNSYSFSFPFLKTLSLVYIEHSKASKVDLVYKFLLGSPSLEKLQLHIYKFLSMNDQPRLQSLSLKFLEFKGIRNEITFQVEAKNVESLVLSCLQFDEIDFSACKKVRNLRLGYHNYVRPSNKLEYFISNFPLLENLTLHFQYAYFEHIRISNKHLQSLVVETDEYVFHYGKGMINTKIITIESAPKLEYFRYEGYIDFSILFESSNSLNGEIVILDKQDYFDTKWFTNMSDFLLNLKCSWNIVTLQVCTSEALIWPENLKNECPYPLLNWKHLRVITDCKPEKEYVLEDALMNLTSLETLSINGKNIF